MFDKLLMLAVFAAIVCVAAQANAGDQPDDRQKQATQLMNDGNFHDAAVIFEALALDASTSPKDAAEDLALAYSCYNEVGLADEAAAVVDKAEKAWRDSWRVLSTVAVLRGGVPADEQQPVPLTRMGRRMPMPSGAGMADSTRAQSLLLFLQAEKHLDDSRDPAAPIDKMHFYANFARIVLNNREGRTAWRLTALTDLAAKPDPADDQPYYAFPQRNAPVEADGSPVYYSIPSSWESAKNDGERWRCALEKLADSGAPSARNAADLILARFLLGQFGVQTITQDSPLDPDAALAGDTGPFAVRTLSDEETIARLATGLRRFKMPSGFNYIKLLRDAANTDNAQVAAPALSLLAQVYENRQQYPKAAAMWRKAVDLKAPESADVPQGVRDPVARAKRLAQDSLKRILGNDGVIELGPVAPAGSKTKLSYMFRNGNKAHFTAYRLDEKKLLEDIRTALRTRPQELMRDRVMSDPTSLGRLVVEKDKAVYIAEETAKWDVALEPLSDHYSRRVDVELPFDKAGCYLIEAEMHDGNTSRIVLWIQDLALVRKPAGDNQLLFVADAVTGEMVPNADMTFLGFDNRYGHATPDQVRSDEFAERTDSDGIVIVNTDKLEKMNWLITAQTQDGRLAYLGFDSIWRMGQPDDSPDNESFFIITDRPVYRPGQDINFKLWYGYSDYSGRPNNVAGKSGKVVIRDPRGEVVYEKTLVTDIFGGADDKLSLDETAPLGQYYMYVDGAGGGSLSFRLEEYKKPEFEVALDAPEKALKLGDSVQLKVQAKYYFGSPVQDAAVSYKIIRTPRQDRWNPPWRWDWLYGAGSWRSNYDYSWYPGFADWGGIRPPLPPWFPVRHVQPELVAEGEGRLDAEGVFRITLDTAPAKALFGNQDHSYQVTAEVTDKSRRTIVGGGAVVAAREPFKVRVWTNRGFYWVGDAMSANIAAMTPTGAPVKASGTATIYRIQYDDKGVPKETSLSSRKVDTDAKGNAEIKFEIKDAGQYRLACKLEDGDRNKVESSTLLDVKGTPGEGDYRFSGLELVPDKRDYKPGELVRLAVNSENKDGLVLFFPRAERNADQRPTKLRLENGSHVVDLTVGRADQPNFFCEALMIYKGRLYSEVREIFVPPADRTLNVQIESDKTEYAPGGKAQFSVKITDADGEPVVGQVVVSIYDRSVEYIAGGSNIGDIRAHFWSWKRYYNSHNTSSLDRYPFNPQKPRDVQWRPIGVFGSQEAHWNDTAVYANGDVNAMPRMQRSRGMPSMGGGMVMKATMMAAPAPAAAPMADMAFEASADMAMPETAAYAGGAETGGGDGGGMLEAVTRSDFADTALWLAALETDADGRATFTVDMPENLTAWKVRTWVMGEGTKVGDGEDAVETRKNVIVRPQAPRFLTQKDQVVLSANLHNYLPRAKNARAELVLEGGLLELAADSIPLARSIDLAANGEARVDWIVNAKRPGSAKVVMKLLTDEESDAAEITIPVVVHGSRRVVNFGGVMADGVASETIRFTVPAERLPDQSYLEFTFAPTVATQLLEALPFLIEYPYGCTEQTLNRFLPLVMTRKFLDGMGATLADAQKAVQNAPDDPQSKEWRDKWGDPRAKAKPAPIFDDAELARMFKQGSDRLMSMQNPDGGWGWFSGAYEQSWPHTTAVVMHGLQAAAELGAPVPADVVARGIDWLTKYQAEQVEKLKADPKADDKDGVIAKGRADNLDAFVYMILARDKRRPLDPEMRDFLYRDRLELSQTGLAMFGIGLHYEKATNALDMVLDNLRQYLRRDPETGVSWLATPSRGWWWWYNDNIETQTWYLKLLSLTEPKGAPAAGVARYLLRNRKNGSYWQSTRDTAYAIEALVEYAKASGETTPDMTVALYLDGGKVMDRKLTAKNLLDDNRFVLDGLAVEQGDHELRLERTGGGNVYYGGGLDLFSLEDPIAASGMDLKVNRSFAKLVRKEKTTDMPTASGVAVQGQVEQYDKVSLPVNGSVPLQSGDLVEVELTIDAANDYEYIIFEDMKAAGLEAVELQSGYLGDRLGSYVEYRDQKVVVFIRYMPKGTHKLTYRFRAEIPGRFSALPTFGGGMYATDLFANSDEAKVGIHENGVFEK